MNRTLIIVPCFNEARSISGVVASISRHVPEATVLVVDDGSTDNTAEVAQQAGARVVSLPINLGIGGAVQTGFRFAARHGFDCAVQVDGDGQHPPSEISKLLECLRLGESDIVVGSRYCDDGRIRGNVSTFSRVVGSGVLSAWIRLLTGAVVTDPTSGFRAVNRSIIQYYAFQYPRDYPEPVSLLWAIQRGKSVKEVSVQMERRAFGTSSIRKFKAFVYMVKVLWSMLLDRIYRADYVRDNC